ncbi:MAG: beta-lactamase family protein, partial [bacterium]|nr:beta-lactamase family protein [bacterium]
MRKKVFTCLNKFIVVAVLCLLIVPFQAQGQSDIISPEEIEKKVLEIMEEGKIPGLSLVIIKGDQTVLLKGLGYADLENKKPVTPDTLFELASCSKSFTGLAALKLEEKGHINLDDPVSKYIPWFHGVYEGITYDKITIRQVLHQTSGIASNSVGLIPQASGADALEKTVRTLEGIELNSIPGTTFEYATMNYDIIGRIVEVVSKKSFEEYMREEILMPLGLNSTIVGVDYENPAALKALGYKIGFFEPRVYNSPVFRGNNPAGYVVSSGRDIATYLKLHLGVLDSDFTHLAQKSHQMDTTVPPSMASLPSYGMGWSVSVNGNGQISHAGYNPNFTAFLGFNHKAKIGVAV